MQHLVSQNSYRIAYPTYYVYPGPGCMLTILKRRFLLQEEQQRVAVGPGNAHLISIRQVSSDGATLQLLLLVVLLYIGNLMTKN